VNLLEIYSYGFVNDLYAMRPETTKFGKITQNKAVSPFQVTDFGTNRKLVYYFLSVINTNLPAILHHLRDIAFEMSIKNIK